MKYIKNKYIKFFFALICVFTLSQSVDAKENYNTIENIENHITIETNVINENVFYLDTTVGFKNKLDKKVAECNGTSIPYGIPYVVHIVINLLKIFTPIILIIMGMLDFFKAVVASDEKQMKESSSRFIRRILAAVVVFLTVSIVQFVFNLLDTEDGGAISCITCFVNGNCSVTEMSNNTSNSSNTGETESALESGASNVIDSITNNNSNSSSSSTGTTSAGPRAGIANVLQP